MIKIDIKQGFNEESKSNICYAYISNSENKLMIMTGYQGINKFVLLVKDQLDFVKIIINDLVLNIDQKLEILKQIEDEQ